MANESKLNNNYQERIHKVTKRTLYTVSGYIRKSKGKLQQIPKDIINVCILFYLQPFDSEICGRVLTLV